MNNHAIIEQLIALEANVANLYRLFAHTFEADRSFWLQMAHEETVHAQVINNNRPLIAKVLTLSRESYTNMVGTAKLMADRIKALTREYRENPPDKREACLAAVQIEESAGEFHFQKVALRLTDPQAKVFFTRLNSDDENHADRIRALMRQVTIGGNAEMTGSS